MVACALALPLALPYSASNQQGHFLMRTLTKQQPSKAMVRRLQRTFAVPKQQVAVRSRSALIATRAPLTSAQVAEWRSAASDFPAFGWTVHPVVKIPDWGRMRSAAEWERSYSDMPDTAFINVPAYDIQSLQTPMQSLIHPIHEQDIPLITAKLYYSTRHLGKYDVDAGENTGFHPGVDLKLAEGTPIGAIAGGRVHVVTKNETLGLHVMIEHRHPTDGTFYSIYGHLKDATVTEGDDVLPGDTIGHVGMTGSTSAPHLHLQVDRSHGEQQHQQYVPGRNAGDNNASDWTMNPIEFIARYAQ